MNLLEYVWILFFHKEKYLEQKEFWERCDAGKIRILWELFFATKVDELDRIEELVYGFGSCVREHDYVGREVFLWLVALHQHIKNH